MRFLITLTVLIFICMSFAGATQTGNIQIVISEPSALHLDNITIELDHAPLTTAKSSHNTLVFWSLATGKHTLTVKLTGDTAGSSCSFTIYPGLTNRLTLVKAAGGLQLADDGFADQSAPILTFDSRTLNNLPGEFTDGAGIFAGGQPNTSRYSWEGLAYRSSGWSWDQSPTLKGAPFSALVNLGDPFAGYDNADISMLSEADSVRFGDIQFTYATRDQRRFRENSNTPLMHGKGLLAVSFAGENSADASPRWNVDSILPHNNTKNGEMTIKFRYDDKSKSRFDLLFLEKHNERLYYLQPYHFDYIHAPKEKTVSLRGQANYQYTPIPDLIFTAGAGWSLDDRKYGDGVAFDNLKGYVRLDSDGYILPNPLTEESRLFYSWNDLFVVNPSDSATRTNEDHYFENYQHDRLKSWQGSLSVQKSLGSQTSLLADIEFSKASLRRYHLLYPTFGSYSVFESDAFGMDTLDHTSDSDSRGLRSPAPKTIRSSLVARHFEKGFFVKASLDYMRFDPGYSIFSDLRVPVDESALAAQGVRFDPAHVSAARAWSRLGYRIALGDRVAKDWDLFINGSLRYEIPVYYYLYSGLDWIQTNTRFRYVATFGNPELKPIQRQEWMMGVTNHRDRNSLSIALFYRRSEKNPVAYFLSAAPHSFGMYMNSPRADYNTASLKGVIASAQGQLSDGLSAYFSAVLTSGTHEADADYLSELQYQQPGILYISPSVYTTLSSSAAVSIDLSKLKALSTTKIGRIGQHCSALVSCSYRTGVLYRPSLPVGEVFANYSPFYHFTDTLPEHAKPYLEFNLQLAARIMNTKSWHLGIRFEILNLLNRSNVLAVYNGSGLADDDGWLGTPDGRDYVLAHQTPSDNSGLTGEQKYRLAMNDPNHFSRPRMIRIAAIMGF
ncbi:MAG: hypothetical protein WAU88_12300 [Candidatus Zixiibacteriota bacterium]